MSDAANPPTTDDEVDPETGLSGPSAPPRANGELAFTAPWQSRLFATTMALRERDLIEWEAFRRSLIAHIAEHTATLASTGDYDYWGCWQAALEQQVAGAGLVEPGALEGRSADLAARPAGHDHGPGDDRDHDHDHPHPQD